MSEEEDFENIRRRFKREALQACQEAEQRGYETGCEKAAEEIGKLQDEIRKWKEICRATSAEIDSEKANKTAPLIKYIMEMIYRDIKHYVSESDVDIPTDAIRVIKEALLSSTESLQKKLPQLVLVKDEAAILRQPHVPVLPNVNSAQLLKCVSVKRPSNLTVNGVLSCTYSCSPLAEKDVGATAQDSKYDFGVSVDTGYLVEPTVRSDKEYVTYDVHSKLVLQQAKQRGGGTPVQRNCYNGFASHRFSDFELLNTSLRKDFPVDVFPLLKLSGASHTGSKQNAVNTRKRQLSLWIKCICTHRLLLASPSVIQFLSKEWENQCTSSVCSFAAVSAGHISEPHILPLPAQRRGDADTSCSSLIYEGADPDDPSIPEDAEVVSAARLTSSLAINSVGKPSTHSYTYSDIVRQQAYRQLHTIERDVLQLEPQYLVTMDCAKTLLTTLELSASAMLALHTSIFDTFPQSSLLLFMPLRGAASQEEAETPEFSTQGMNLSAVTANACIERESDILTEYFMEPIVYMQCNYMPQMKQSIAATCTLPIGSDERVEAIDKTSLEWNIFRETRQKIGVDYLLNGAKRLRDEHRQQQQQWMKMAEELKKLEFSEIPAYVPFKSKRGANLTHPDADPSAAYAAGNSTGSGGKAKADDHGSGHSATGSGKESESDSFVRCMLWRPVVPAGTRRRPSVQPPNPDMTGDLAAGINNGKKPMGRRKSDVPKGSYISPEDQGSMRYSESATMCASGGDDGEDGYWVQGAQGGGPIEGEDARDDNEFLFTTNEQYFPAAADTNPIDASTIIGHSHSTPSAIKKKKEKKGLFGFRQFLFGDSTSLLSSSKMDNAGDNTVYSDDVDSGLNPNPNRHEDPHRHTVVAKRTSVIDTLNSNMLFGSGQDTYSSCSKDMNAEDISAEVAPSNSALSRAYEKQQEKLQAARRVQQDKEIQDELDRQVGVHGAPVAIGQKKAVGSGQGPAPITGAGVRRMKTQSTKITNPAPVPVPTAGHAPVPVVGTPSVASSVGKEDHFPSSNVPIVEPASPAVKHIPAASSTARKQSKASYSWGAEAAEPLVSHHTRDHSNTNTATNGVKSSTHATATPGAKTAACYTVPITKKGETTVQADTAATTSMSAVTVAEELSSAAAGCDGGDKGDGWEEVVPADGGRVYYYHRTTRVSRWDKPDDYVTEAMQERLEQTRRAEQVAIARRKEELGRKRAEEDEKAALADKYEANIKAAVLKWAQQPHFGGSCLGQLLGTLHVVIPSLFPEPLSVSLANSPDGAAVDTLVSKKSDAPGIKKGYVKAVRSVHPDKLAVGVDLHTKLLAEEVFIVLSQQYEKYRRTQ